jgi:hypothetical protein
MVYPNNIVTNRAKILHNLHVNVTMTREEMLETADNVITLRGKISNLLTEGLITTDRLNRLTITEIGNRYYAKLISAATLPVVSQEELMTVFTKRANPKGVNAVMVRFYKGKVNRKSRNKVYHMLCKLVTAHQLIAIKGKKNTTLYLHPENPLAKKHIKEITAPVVLSDEELRLEIDTNYRKTLLPLFFSILPGTLTAGEGKKERVY